MRVTLIHNAGAGDDDQPDGGALQALLCRHGHTVRYQSCSDDTWAAALGEPADIVAVAGGDGTVGLVAKKLIGRDIAVAPLPLGTANNIARTLGLVDRPLDEVVAGWSHGRSVSFDAGVASGPWGSRYFVEAMGVGLFARAITAAERNRTLAALTDAESRVAYAQTMLHDRLEQCAPHRLELTLDGNRFSGDYVLFEAMNMEFVGPNLYLAPDMRPDDGLLDVILVTAAERDKLKQSIASWRDGNLRSPDLTRYRASHIQLEWTGFEVHIDDEPWPAEEGGERPRLGRIELRIEPRALRFLGSAAAESR